MIDDDYLDMSDKISDLEAKLAESEREIEKIKIERAEVNEISIIRKWEIDDLKQQLAEKEKEIKDLQDYISCSGCVSVIAKVNQDKISFAVAELKKVSKYVDGRTYLAQYLQDRINELKEGK